MPRLRADAAQLAGFDQRREHSLVVAALVGAGEQRVLAVERKATQRAFSYVFVDLKRIVFDVTDVCGRA